MPGLLNKQGTMPALKEKLSAEVQEVVQLLDLVLLLQIHSQEP